MRNKEIQLASDLENSLGCGSYQIFVVIIWQLISILNASTMLFMSFGKIAPTAWHFISDHVQSSPVIANYTFPWNDTEKCQLFIHGNCSKMHWETDFHSIVTEWQLICDHTPISYLIISVQMLGVLLGSLVYGQLSDSYGRKWTLFISLLSLVALEACSVFSPNWQSFLAFRFFIGFSCGGTIVISHVLTLEVLKAKHRLWVTVIGGWPLGFAVLAGLAYASRDWKTLSLAIAAFGVPALVMIPFTSESPRWLLQKQKFVAARRSMRSVMKWNGQKQNSSPKQIISLFQDTLQPLKSVSRVTVARKYTYWHLCQTRRLAMNTAVVMFEYMAISIVSYGILLNNDKLTGNKYLNFALLAFIRFISNLVTPIVDTKRCSRKYVTAICFALIAMISLIIAFIMVFAPSTSGHAVTSLVIIATTLTSPIWALLYLVPVEAFPTPVRNMAVGVGGTFNRVGGIITPFFLYMAELWKPSPYVVYAIVGLLSAFMCGFMLPETKNKPMPDFMPDPDRKWWLCCGKNHSEALDKNGKKSLQA